MFGFKKQIFPGLVQKCPESFDFDVHLASSGCVWPKSIFEFKNLLVISVVDMKDINKLNKRDVENEIINEFSISLILISKTLFDRYIKIKMIIKLEIIDAEIAKKI